MIHNLARAALNAAKSAIQGRWNLACRGSWRYATGSTTGLGSMDIADLNQFYRDGGLLMHAISARVVVGAIVIVSHIRLLIGFVRCSGWRSYPNVAEMSADERSRRLAADIAMTLHTTGYGLVVAISLRVHHLVLLELRDKVSADLALYVSRMVSLTHRVARSSGRLGLSG